MQLQRFLSLTLYLVPSRLLHLKNNQLKRHIKMGRNHDYFRLTGTSINREKYKSNFEHALKSHRNDAKSSSVSASVAAMTSSSSSSSSSTTTSMSEEGTPNSDPVIEEKKEEKPNSAQNHETEHPHGILSGLLGQRRASVEVE